MNESIDWAERLARSAQGTAQRLSLALRADAEADNEGAEISPPAESTSVAPANIWIAYENDAGDESERTLTLRKVWRRGGVLYFQGACHLRRAVRTFKAANVIGLVCLTTGEAPDEPDAWLAEHALFTDDEHQIPSPDRTHLAVRHALPGLTLLVFLARSDDALDADEVEVCIDYVMMSTTAEVDRSKLERVIARMVPDPEEVVGCFDYFAREPERWAKLQRAARRLVDADRQILVGEQEAWRFLEQQFARSVAAREESERRRMADWFGFDAGNA